jgi:hypothetical protein
MLTRDQKVLFVKFLNKPFITEKDRGVDLWKRLNRIQTILKILVLSQKDNRDGEISIESSELTEEFFGVENEKV